MNQQCVGPVCEGCVRWARRHFRQYEADQIQWSRDCHLCLKCRQRAVRAYPNGHRGCICKRLINRGRKCWACRWTTDWQLRRRYHRAQSLLFNVHIDILGRAYVGPSNRQRKTIPCPGCGAVHHQGLSLVFYCLTCNGIGVPNLGQQPTRRSARIAAKIGEEKRIGLDLLRH